VEITFVISANSLSMAKKIQEKQAVPLLALDGHCLSALPTFSLNEIVSINNASILMNRFYFERDLPDLQAVLNQLKGAPISSIYFSDPAVYQLADSLRGKLVYKPETLAVNYHDCRFWEEQKIQCVSVSPLLTKEETLNIIGKCKDVELFLFGHSILSFSYRKLISAYQKYGHFKIQQKDNRSLFLREEKRKGFMPIFENELGCCIYSDYVLNSFYCYQEFIHTGANRFYLESAYLNEEDVFDALAVFRQEMDIKEYQMKYSFLPLDEGYYVQATNQ